MTGISKAESGIVLDQEQLVRIQATHRGFLYQHFFSVGCILKLHGLKTGEVRVERDEDVEVEFESDVHFIQVKHLAGNLVLSDIKGALERFEQIRRSTAVLKAKHFHIVSSSELGPRLAKDVDSADWPSDVLIHTPNREIRSEFLPKIHPDIGGMLSECTESAQALPFRSLDPETLVWKLAARVQFAATGRDQERSTHAFKRHELHELFELLVMQLQDFAAVPVDYRPQSDEPDITSDASIRLISGFSGAGKTLWAAQQARHSSASMAYFDLKGLSGGAVAGSIARELAARFVVGSSDGSALLPASTGLEMLRQVCDRVDLPERPVLVLDNVQRIDAEILSDVLDVCSPLRIVCLAQPWDGQTLISAKHGFEVETLKGWSIDTLAAEFADNGVAISPQTARKWHELTSGLPLFVKSAVNLCQTEFGGDADQALASVLGKAHTSELAQEVLLEEQLKGLSDAERKVVGALSLTKIDLTLDEVTKLMSGTDSNKTSCRRALKSLSRIGLMQSTAGGGWRLHDALSILGEEIVEDLGEDGSLKLRVKLRDLLFESVLKSKDLTRLGAWIRLLGPTGQAHVLAEIAGEEAFHEIGNPSDLKEVLQSAANDPEASPQQQYSALDALVFWELQEDKYVRNPEPALKQLEELVATNSSFSVRDKAGVAMKRMMVAGMQEDIPAVNAVFENLKPDLKGDRELELIVRYNWGTSLFHAGDIHRAKGIATEVAQAYCEAIKLDPDSLIGKNAQRIRSLLPADLSESHDDIKHLADAFELVAMCKRKLGERPFFQNFHAVKLYQQVRAFRSQMRAGQDIADDLLEIGDKQGSLEVMESFVLPALHEFNFDTRAMDARGQYAVILAYNGYGDRARAEMKAISAFAADLPPEYRAGLQNQRNMIEQISAQNRYQPALNSNTLNSTNRKVGRNETCPCGSGTKFKRCCGR
ncbi:MAG: SEC-C metal-binding domain-containing protein [Maritimibacter sp.]